jgi:hypothetical protein
MIKSYSSSLRARTFLEEALEELGASEPEAALHRLRRMKQLLLRYHEEQRKLNRLGLADVDEVFDAMLAMKERADHLKEQVEAYRAAQEKLHAIQDALDVDASAEQTVETIERISAQLESLYEDRELLSRAGVADATEAVRLIQSMREQLDQVYAEMEQSEHAPLDRLEQELGVSDPESVLDMIESMEAQLAAEYEADADAPASPAEASGGPASSPLVVRALERQVMAAQTGEADVPREEGPSLVAPDLLDTLSERPPDALADLDVGVVALDDDARIRVATPHTPLFPGLEGTPDGDPFFDRCPAARSPLLEAPLRRGRTAGRLDHRFVFAVPRPDADAPLPLLLHLYRAAESGPTWLLYDRLR